MSADPATLNSRLERQSYLSGTAPTQLDAKTFVQLKQKDLSAFPATNRWFDHIASFSEFTRSTWPAGTDQESQASPSVPAPAQAASKEAAPAKPKEDAPEAAEEGEGGLSKRALEKQRKKDAKKAAKAANNPAAAQAATAAAAAEVDVSMYEPQTGTRDFFPEDKRMHSWLFGKFRETARLFAFQEYDAPVLESQELYTRKAGEEIVDQMYAFDDKGGRQVTLRPEMTPSLARMVLSEGGKRLMPFKWYSIPQCWRYEAVQRGRKREHYQWNMDIIGEPTISAEAELLAAVTNFFTSVGITSKDVGIKVNSRKVLQCVIEMHNVPTDDFAKVCVVVDKLDKIGAEETVKLLVGLGLTQKVGEDIVKSLSLRSIAELKEMLGGSDNAAVMELEQLFQMAKDYGYDDWIIFDASVVRGLAYYTGIVFEGFDRKGELRAICGGGRYDKLMSLYSNGTSQVPACGFGFGDCVIMELLREKSVLPVLSPGIEFVVVPYSPEMQGPALQVAQRLRADGAAVDVMLQPRNKLKQAFSYADRLAANKIVLVAPDEWNKGLVRVKDLRSEDKDNNQWDIPFSEFVPQLKEKGLLL